jgi:hypothetical protein
MKKYAKTPPANVMNSQPFSDPLTRALGRRMLPRNRVSAANDLADEESFICVCCGRSRWIVRAYSDSAICQACYQEAGYGDWPLPTKNWVPSIKAPNQNASQGILRA